MCLPTEEGQALSLSHYFVEPGEGLAKGIELATRIASNAFLTNFAVMHALPRIAEQDRASGYVMEGLMAAIAGGGEEAKARVKAFLEKRAPESRARLTRCSRRAIAMWIWRPRGRCGSARAISPSIARATARSIIALAA